MDKPEPRHIVEGGSARYVGSYRSHNRELVSREGYACVRRFTLGSWPFRRQPSHRSHHQEKRDQKMQYPAGSSERPCCVQQARPTVPEAFHAGGTAKLRKRYVNQLLNEACAVEAIQPVFFPRTSFHSKVSRCSCSQLPANSSSAQKLGESWRKRRVKKTLIR